MPLKTLLISGPAHAGKSDVARLASGEEGVVKVLRPGIDVLVETDLAAIALALRWLKWYKRVSNRVDLDWLAREFAAITRNELDLHAEGKNAEHFAKDFANDLGVYIPKIYWKSIYFKDPDGNEVELKGPSEK